MKTLGCIISTPPLLQVTGQTLDVEGQKIFSDWVMLFDENITYSWHFTGWKIHPGIYDGKLMVSRCRTHPICNFLYKKTSRQTSCSIQDVIRVLHNYFCANYFSDILKISIKFNLWRFISKWNPTSAQTLHIPKQTSESTGFNCFNCNC